MSSPLARNASKVKSSTAGEQPGPGALRANEATTEPEERPDYAVSPEPQGLKAPRVRPDPLGRPDSPGQQVRPVRPVRPGYRCSTPRALGPRGMSTREKPPGPANPNQ